MVGREWGHRDTRGTSSGGQVDKRETREGTIEEFLNITPEELWRLQKILGNKKGSLNQTCKKITEANAKVYDLNQKTMQASESLAAVYAVFENAGGDLNVGTRSATLSSHNIELPWMSSTWPSRTRSVRGEELYDAQEAHAMAFMDLQERMSKMKFLNKRSSAMQRERPKMLKIKSRYTENAVAACRRCTGPRKKT